MTVREHFSHLRSDVQHHGQTIGNTPDCCSRSVRRPDVGAQQCCELTRVEALKVQIWV